MSEDRERLEAAAAVALSCLVQRAGGSARIPKEEAVAHLGLTLQVRISESDDILLVLVRKREARVEEPAELSLCDRLDLAPPSMRALLAVLVKRLGGSVSVDAEDVSLLCDDEEIRWKGERGTLTLTVSRPEAAS